MMNEMTNECFTFITTVTKRQTTKIVFNVFELNTVIPGATTRCTNWFHYLYSQKNLITKLGAVESSFFEIVFRRNLTTHPKILGMISTLPNSQQSFFLIQYTLPSQRKLRRKILKLRHQNGCRSHINRIRACNTKLQVS